MIRYLAIVFAYFMFIFSVVWLSCMIFEIIGNAIKRLRHKRNTKKMLKNPYEYYKIPKVKINKINDVKRPISNMIGYVDREPDVDEILGKALYFNPACINFIRYRNDLFEDFDDYEIPDDKLIKPEARKLKYYYVKVKSDNCYLGYIVASDEIEGGDIWK